jgi:hypothetical protein
MDKKTIVIFKGDRAEIHRQLKIFCATKQIGVNETIIDAIEYYLKKHK